MSFLALLATGIVVAVARSVWLGCVAAALLGVVVASHDRARLAKFGALMGIAGALTFTGLSVEHSKLIPQLAGKVESFVFHQTNNSAAPIANSRWRVRVWGQTLHHRILPNLVAGEGFGRPAVAGTPLGDELAITDPRTQVHDGYLTYLMREGVIGFGLFAILIGGAVWRVGTRVRHLQDAEERLFALALLCALTVYLVDIGFGVIIEGPMGGIPFWLLLGLAYVKPGSAVEVAQGEAG